MFAIGEVYLGYNRKVNARDAQLISTSQTAVEVLRSVWDAETINLRESFKVLLVSRSNRAINVYHHSEGSVSSSLVDVRLIVQAALLANASGIILAHNHPSGNKYPSDSDTAITNKIRDAAQLFDINVLDHIILTDDDYLSFSDRGLI
jgi:DNA repair protein RadC